MSRIVPLSRLRERGGGEGKPSDIAAERPKEVPPNGKRIARRVKDSSQLSNTRRSTPERSELIRTLLEARGLNMSLP